MAAMRAHATLLVKCRVWGRDRVTFRLRIQVKVMVRINVRVSFRVRVRSQGLQALNPQQCICSLKG